MMPIMSPGGVAVITCPVTSVAGELAARSGQGPSFARLSQVLGAVAQSGSAPRSHRGGQGFKSPQLHPKPQVRAMIIHHSDHGSRLFDRHSTVVQTVTVSDRSWPSPNGPH